MKDLTIVIPSKNENPKYANYIKKNAKCDVIIVYDKKYGEAIKDGIKRSDTKYIMTMDADGQHTLKEARKLYKAFKLAGCDLMIGDRRLTKGEWYRVLASTLINAYASIFSGRWVVDLNSGMRIFKKENADGYSSILCDHFSYTTSLAMSHLSDNLNVEWFPISVMPRCDGKSHVKKLRDGITTIFYITKIGFALRTRGIRSWIRSMKLRYL